MRGKVILVGAGPGDPGLLTLRGRAWLSRADVVVHDRLSSPLLLDLAPPGALFIDVGKRAACHPVPQGGINRILVEQAQAGKTVVRLKGGDPFLFGRGGEELEELRQAGIPFEVVPGVTSAIAAPAYGGIPVTHRDWASSVHIITGHARAGKGLDIDFDALVRAGGTLVFLMGVSSLPRISAGLLAAGMDPATPAALVERGTTPAQRRVDATLETLTCRAGEAGVESPTVIVVGPVCALAPGFDWYDDLPLRGRRVVVTRPRERSGVLAGRLRDLGAEVFEFPCIETQPILPCPGAEEALAHLERYDWLALTSPAGAECLWALLMGMGRDARALAPVGLAAIGPGTARALEAFGLKVDLVPAVYDAAHLGEALAGEAVRRALILRAQEGSADLTAALDRAGAAYDDIPVYTTRRKSPRAEELQRLLEAGQGELVTFTSASTVQGFVQALGGDVGGLRITGVCIGAQTAAEAAKWGIRTVTAQAATIDALVEAVRALCADGRKAAP